MPQTKENVIILCNLGTPLSTSSKDIKAFLHSLLSNPNIHQQTLLWRFILKFFILPRAVPKVKAKYESIWLKAGSPLLIHTQELAQKLELELKSNNANYKVLFAMCHSQPSLEKVLSELDPSRTAHITVLPLFPQYSFSTTKSIEDKLKQILKTRSKLQTIPFSFIKSFSNTLEYQEALFNQIEATLLKHRIELLLVSFHSLPLKLIKKGDPYQKASQDLFINVKQRFSAQIPEIRLCYQSAEKFGKWLTPSLEDELELATKEGKTKVSIISPSFIAECSETIIDIQKNANVFFRQQTNSDLIYIPCLNAEDFWVKKLAQIITRNTASSFFNL